MSGSARSSVGVWGRGEHHRDIMASAPGSGSIHPVRSAAPDSGVDIVPMTTVVRRVC